MTEEENTTIDMLIRNILLSEDAPSELDAIDIGVRSGGIFRAGLRWKGTYQYGKTLRDALVALAAARIVEREDEAKERAERDAKARAELETGALPESRL